MIMACRPLWQHFTVLWSFRQEIHVNMPSLLPINLPIKQPYNMKINLQKQACCLSVQAAPHTRQRIWLISVNSLLLMIFTGVIAMFNLIYIFHTLNVG